MKRREKILALLLVLGALGWAVPHYAGQLFNPLEDRWRQLKELDVREGALEKQEQQLLQTRRQMGRWKTRSLPPDEVVAQRLYQQWLTDLAHMAGLSSGNPAGLHIVPEPAHASLAAFKSVRVTVKCEATFQQLATFLRAFQRIDLLHRIAQLKVESPKAAGALLKISLVAEGMCLADASPRARLLPKTQLKESLPMSFDTVKLVSAEGFPTEPGFDARIGNEIVTVTKVSGVDWTVKRAVEGSLKVRHPPKTEVEGFPVRADRMAIKWEDQNKALAVHPFTRPASPQGIDPNDPARQTRLILTVVDANDDRDACLYNKITKAKTPVRKGTTISVGDIQGVVVAIEPKSIQIQRGSEVWELGMGKNLRSMTRSDGSSDDGFTSDFLMGAGGSPNAGGRRGGGAGALGGGNGGGLQREGGRFGRDGGGLGRGGERDGGGRDGFRSRRSGRRDRGSETDR